MRLANRGVPCRVHNGVERNRHITTGAGSPSRCSGRAIPLITPVLFRSLCGFAAPTGITPPSQVRSVFAPATLQACQTAVWQYWLGCQTTQPSHRYG